MMDKMSDSDSDMSVTTEFSSVTSTNISRQIQEDSPQIEKSFRPLNFPTSPEFTPPPRIRTPLPGIVPERPAPYETEQEQGPREEVEVEESKLTWLHVLVVLIALCSSVAGAIYTMWALPGTRAPLLTPATFHIEGEVNARVFGQPQAVAKLLEILRGMTREESCCKTILFAGGPGVGKDFLAQVVKDHFYAVAGPQCKDHSYLSLQTRSLRCVRKDFNLFSLETVYSLDEAQLQRAAITLNSLVRACRREKHKIAFILPVLTVKAYSIASLDVRGVDSFSSSAEYWQSVKSAAAEVKPMFEESELVMFKPLSWSHVKMCIAESAQRQARAALSQDTVDEILKLLLTGTAQDFVPVGCKDVDSMVAVLPPQAS